jgi:hypothetical protein
VNQNKYLKYRCKQKTDLKYQCKQKTDLKYQCKQMAVHERKVLVKTKKHKKFLHWSVKLWKKGNKVKYSKCENWLRCNAYNIRNSKFSSPFTLILLYITTTIPISLSTQSCLISLTVTTVNTKSVCFKNENNIIQHLIYTLGTKADDKYSKRDFFESIIHERNIYFRHQNLILNILHYVILIYKPFFREWQ